MRYMTEYAEVVHHPKEDAMMECIYGKSTDLDKVIDEVKFQHGSMGDKSTAFFGIIKSASMEQIEAKEILLH